MDKEKVYEAAIIGAGPGGLTAGIYLARAGVKTILFERLIAGGQLAISEWVENYPGFPEGIEGGMLSEQFKKQAMRFGVEINQDEVIQVKKEGSDKIIRTKSKKDYRCLGVIIATGASPKQLNIPGERELQGRGVSYCATCDGPLFKDKEVVVIGGGDTAVQEAIFLAKFCKKVSLVHRRDRLRATKILQERIEALKEKIEPVWNCVPVEVKGEGRVEAVVVKDVKIGKLKGIPCQGVFIFAGTIPNSSFLKRTVKLDRQGYIIADEDMKTSAKGVYACGDVRKKLFRQVVTACGEGATAAFACQHYIEHIKGTEYK